jgi:hypothetical protein
VDTLPEERPIHLFDFAIGSFDLRLALINRNTDIFFSRFYRYDIFHNGLAGNRPPLPDRDPHGIEVLSATQLIHGQRGD